VDVGNDKMKHFIIISILIIFIFFHFISNYIFFENTKIEVIVFDDVFDFNNILEDGFIICTLGNNFWSNYFSNLSEHDKRFSHLGVIRVNNGVITVIHSSGTIKGGNDYVKEELMEDYIRDIRAIGIYKFKGLESYKISLEAINYIGVPFDWQFDLSDNTKLYCTELLYVILKKIIPEVELRKIYNCDFNREIIPLESISNSSDFEEIFYKII